MSKVQDVIRCLITSRNVCTKTYPCFRIRDIKLFTFVSVFDTLCLISSNILFEIATLISVRQKNSCILKILRVYLFFFWYGVPQNFYYDSEYFYQKI